MPSQASSFLSQFKIEDWILTNFTPRLKSYFENAKGYEAQKKELHHSNAKLPFMKFSCRADINAPLNAAVSLFDNTDNLKKWQEGFVSMEHISGEPGTVGAKSKIIYKTKKHIIQLIETIKVKNLPEEMTALYEHDHMDNLMSNRFTSLNANQTRLETRIDYIKFKSFMPKLMALLMPGMFKKQTQKWVDHFKAFVEAEQQKSHLFK